MVIRAALLFAILPSVLLLNEEGTLLAPFTRNFTTGSFLKETAAVSVPFTHDFDSGLHGWNLNAPYWTWTGNDNSLPDFKHLPEFSFNGDIVYTQKHLPNSFSNDMSLTLFNVTGVTKATRFTFAYWFYTDLMSGSFGLYFYLMDFSSSQTYYPIRTIKLSYSGWYVLVINCEEAACCLSDNCNLQIQVIGSVGYNDDYGIAAISSVTASNSGSTPKTSHTLMAITSIVLASLIIKPLSR